MARHFEPLADYLDVALEDLRFAASAARDGSFRRTDRVRPPA